MLPTGASFRHCFWWRLSHVTQMNESCHTYEWVMSHTGPSFGHCFCLRPGNVVTGVWHDSFICVTWLMYMCGMAHSCVWHDSFLRVTWLIHVCDMTHSYVWHNSVINVTWLIYMYGTTHSCIWNVCEMTRATKSGAIYICKSHVTHMNVSCHPYEWVMSHTCIWNDSCDTTQSYVWRISFMFDMIHSYCSRRRSDLNIWIFRFFCPVFLETLLSDGDSVYSPTNLVENLKTPDKTCLICTGTSVKTCLICTETPGKFWQS